MKLILLWLCFDLEIEALASLFTYIVLAPTTKHKEMEGTTNSLFTQIDTGF